MRKIGNTENYYITLTGKVFNLEKMKWLKLTKRKDGYYIVALNQKLHLVHRLIADAYIPKVDGKNFINHIDGNKSNNNIFNLEWCTQKENLQHAWNIGLSKTTERQRQNGRNTIKIASEIGSKKRRKSIIDTSNGKTFEYAEDAAKYLGVRKQTLTNWLNGHRTNKTSLKYI